MESAGGCVSVEADPRLNKEPPGSQHLARWPLTSRLEPWLSLGSLSRDDVGGKRRPARPEREGGGLSAPGEAEGGGWELGTAQAICTPGTLASTGPELVSFCLACACLPHCTPATSAPGVLNLPPTHSARRPGSGQRRKLVWVASWWPRLSQEWEAMRSDPGERLQLITVLGFSHFFPHLLLSLSPPPDTLPVLRPGHQPDYPAPWAGGQSIPGARPAWLPTPPASVSGQTWSADILFPEDLGRGAGPR